MKNQLFSFVKYYHVYLFALLFSLMTLKAFANGPQKQVCEIWDVVAIAQDCDSTDMFLVTINFNYDGIGDLGFKVTGNGNNYGEFSYGDLPVTVGPLAGNCETTYEFVITDLQLPDCSDFAVLGPVCCTAECSISNILVETLECTGVNQYALAFDFTYSNVSGVGFDLYTVNDVFLGYYLYENLPITITDFPASGNDLDWILICDNDSEICCQDQSFPALNCSATGDCNIYDMVYEVHPCNADDMFYIDLNFQYENVGSLGFSVYGNGTNYGTFSYDSLFITLGPFAGDCTTDWEFLAKDVEFESCSDFVEVGPICCGTACEIFDINVDPTECTGVNTYNLWLNFGYSNVNGSGFDVYGPGNVYIGYYLYADLPVLIQDFPSSGNANDWIKVCDSDSESCCKTKEFPALDCPGEECHIYDLVVEAYECDSSDMFYVDLTFNYNNVGQSGFTVMGNGNNYGTFSYDSLYITLGPLQGGCDISYEFIVKDVDFPDCSAVFELGTACCQPCEIFEINVDPIECTGFNTYDLWLDFGYSNVNSASFDVYGPGNVLVGNYLYADLPVLIEDFPSSGNDFDWLKVCDHETEGCCKVKEFPALDCPGDDCHIYDLIVEAYACDSSDMFYVDLTFNYNNVGENGFTIMGNGNNYGTFSYDSLYITLGPLQGGCDISYEFIVKDVDFPDCSAVFELGTACCQPCEIFEINVDPIECTGFNTYDLWLNFGYSNVNSVSFDVYGPGNALVGTYLYADLPLLIEDFPSSGNDFDWLKVCDHETEGCCKVKEFPALDCPGDECHIYDLVVEAYECNNLNQFYVDIIFNFVNVGENGFMILGNGNNYGTFSYDSLYITLGPLEGGCDNVYEFVIQDVDFPDCTAVYELGTTCCDEDCEIFELEVDPVECTGVNTYDLWLNFGYANVNSASFDVYGPGNVLVGTYLYADLPVLIEDFPSSGNDFDWLKVCDHETEGCCKVIEFQALDCGGEECNISNITVLPLECTGVDQYAILLNFNYSNVNSVGFEVYGPNNQYIGYYLYSNLPVLILEFPASGNNNDWLLVCDNDSESCCEDAEFEALSCGGEDCILYNLMVDPGECTSDSTYSLFVNFDYQNTSGIGFDLAANGSYFGFYTYDQLPLVINNFPKSGFMYDWIAICDNDNLECCTGTEFMTLECTTAVEEPSWKNAIGMYTITEEIQRLDLSAFQRDEEVQMDVFQIDGKKILSMEITPDELFVDINLQNYATAMYIVRLEYKGQIYAKQFIKLTQ